jgi:hypothetical protein
LQWLDAATLDFLEDLLTQPDVQHLMLIGWPLLSWFPDLS